VRSVDVPRALNKIKNYMKSVLFLSLALLTVPSVTTANETPSNEELFEMFKQS